MENQKALKDIKTLLLFIVIPLIFYVLHILSTIFIPLSFGFFGALLFSPIMRWCEGKKIHKFVGLLMVAVIVFIIGIGVYEIFRLAGNELAGVNQQFIDKMNSRFDELVQPILNYTGNSLDEIGTRILSTLKTDKAIESIFGNVTSGIGTAANFLSMLILSLFFMVLLLAGSVNIPKVMKTFLLNDEEHSSSKAYKEIEGVVFKYILVKTFISLLTGLGFTIICYIFGVSFPILWGVVAFFLNFIQFIGSGISIVAISLFAIVELSLSGTWVFFMLLTIGIHVGTGGILEPILMGKSFSINTITILIMLALWGIVWGIPGMIISIPMTAFIKKVMGRNPGGKTFAKLMS